MTTLIYLLTITILYAHNPIISSKYDTDMLNYSKRSQNRHLLFAKNHTWISPRTPYLPRKDSLSAIASYNHSILLLGGGYYTKQLVRFDISTQEITDFGNNTLSIPVWGDAQYYSQTNEMLYWIDSDSSGKYIMLYDLTSNTLLQDNITIPNSVGKNGCLASYNKLLYLVGGYSKKVLNILQYYNISSQTWELGPIMQTARRRLSCIVNNKHLYAIGGQTNNKYLKSIEIISIKNISSNKWEYIHNMSNPRSLTRAVNYRNYIFIIGGRDLVNNTYYYSSEVLVINTENNQISSGGYLNHGIFGASSIVMNEIIYIFGGAMNWSVTGVNYWQYCDLQLDTTLTTQAPIITSVNSESTAGVITTSTSAITDVDNICSSQHEGYINSTYKTSVVTELCDEGIRYIDFLFKLIEIVDIVYRHNDFVVVSTISKHEKDRFSTITICENITFHLITCFDEETDANELFNFTESTNFETSLNDELTDNNYTIIIYVKNTTVVTIILPIKNNNHMILISFVSGIFICIIVILIASFILYQKLRRIKNQMLIQNAMVILLAIGNYDKFPAKPDVLLQNVFLPDLDASNIEKDIQQLYQLFGPNKLNYCVYPRYKNINHPKTRWTERQILALLKKKAAEFDKSDAFDALIVVLSAHGVSNSICTSDYQLLDKSFVHRLFSSNYYSSRNKPRIFIFDSCEGDDMCGDSFDEDNADENSPLALEMHMTGHVRTLSTIQNNVDDEANVIDEDDVHDEQNKDVGKSAQIQDIQQNTDSLWPSYAKNPDYRLVQINSANPGFQSRMDLRFGSHMLYQFATKTLDDLNKHNNKNSKYLHEIFDEIQKELHDNGKQHIVATYNDQTRYIRFRTKDK